jgi:hypothetical protein
MEGLGLTRRGTGAQSGSGDDGDGRFMPRVMVGLLAQLPPENRARVLAHEGEDSSGRADLPTIGEMVR